jgi:hypothetical protein
MRKDLTNCCSNDIILSIYNKDFSKKTGSLQGLNTAWASGGDEDEGNLSPGKDMVRDGLARLQDCQIRFVLGHHSIDWFLNHQDEREIIRTLFGEKHVFYLHGDMHTNRVYEGRGAGHPFLVMQTGATYQENEDALLINRLLRCELYADVEHPYIQVRPLKWERIDQRWVPDNLPGSEKYRKGDTNIYEFKVPGSERAVADTPEQADAQQIILAGEDALAVKNKQINSLGRGTQRQEYGKGAIGIGNEQSISSPGQPSPMSE